MMGYKKRKNNRKRQSQERHFAARTEERVGAVLSVSEVRKLIRRGQLKFFGRQSCRVTLFEYSKEGTDYIIVYDSLRSQPVTILFKDLFNGYIKPSRQPKRSVVEMMLAEKYNNAKSDATKNKFLEKLQGVEGVIEPISFARELNIPPSKLDCLIRQTQSEGRFDMPMLMQKVTPKKERVNERQASGN